MQRSFSQNAAHEFRTPLAVLKTRIGLFRKKQDFAPQTTEAFPQYYGERGGSTLRHGGQPSEADQSGTGAPQRPNQIGRTAPPSCRGCFPSGRQKGIAILVEASPGTITGSRELLRRALFNLVENAVKYGPDGGQTRLCAELNGADIVITVANQGPCIPPELRERIFEPFFRADTARSWNWGCRPGAGPGPGHCRNPRRQRMGGGKSGWLESIFGPASGSMFMRENHHSLLCY